MKTIKLVQFSGLALAISLFISCGSSTEVSAEMEGFAAAVTSTKSIDKAAEKYGYSSDDTPLSFYELGETEVTGSIVDGEKTCYDLNVKHGFIDSDIVVCWENGKITSITDK